MSKTECKPDTHLPVNVWAKRKKLVVIDSTQDLDVVLVPGVIAKSKAADPMRCAIALSLKHRNDVKEAYVTRGTTGVVFKRNPHVLVKFDTLRTARDVQAVNDANGSRQLAKKAKAAPLVVRLGAIPPSGRKEARAEYNKRRRSKPSGPQRAHKSKAPALSFMR